MTTKKKFKSDAFEAIHESAAALLSVGAIDKATMRKFDASCLAKTPDYKAVQIKKKSGKVQRLVNRSLPCI